MLILSSLPSASTTTKKARHRLRPKDKTTPHPEVPQTILGKYVICDLFCIRRYPTYLFKVKYLLVCKESITCLNILCFFLKNIDSQWPLCLFFLLSDYSRISEMRLLGVVLSWNNLVKATAFTKLALTLLRHLSPWLWSRSCFIYHLVDKTPEKKSCSCITRK